jgi:hippurate hydrolase
MRCAVGVLLLFAAGAANAQPADVDSRYDKEIDSLIAARYRHIDSLYKDIHAHPELAFQEVETARKLAKELRDLGFEVTEGVGKTGVVGVLRNGPGPTVLVRTELDARPLE